jgi:acyl dehydratase
VSVDGHRDRARDGGSVASAAVKTSSFRVPVEAGHVLQFRRALGLGDDGPPPPTFVMVADHFDPAFPRRPRAGWPWLGSASGPSGVADGDPAHEGLFHVEHRLEHGAPLVVGETVTAHRLPPREWTKQGRRGGQLTFVETTTELVGDDGELAVRSVWLDVATERSHAALTAAQTRGAAVEAAPYEPAADATSTVLVDELTRTQIVMYVGAAGDLHPLHHDDVYCRHRGLPGVFAPGMLTMGLTGRAVCHALAVDVPTGFGGRLHAQVWPGDTLTAHVVDADPTEHGMTGTGGRAVAVATTNQHGTVVFSGWATAALLPSA